jgi:hypothetical protein
MTEAAGLEALTIRDVSVAVGVDIAAPEHGGFAAGSPVAVAGLALPRRSASPAASPHPALRRATDATAVLADAETGNDEIAAKSPTDKLLAAWEAAKPHLAKDAVAQLAALMTPESLGMMAGFTVAYVVAQATPVGWVADGVALASIGVTAFFQGRIVLDVTRELMGFAAAVSAHNKKDIEQAGAALSQAITTGGMVLVTELLTHAISAPGDGKAGATPTEAPPGYVDALTSDGRIVRAPAEAAEHMRGVDTAAPGLPEQGAQAAEPQSSHGPAAADSAPKNSTTSTENAEATAQAHQSAPRQPPSRSRGATASGTGAQFKVEEHAAGRDPVVTKRPGTARPTSPETAGKHPGAVEPPQRGRGSTADEIAAIHDEATQGTGRGGTSPSDPDELNASPDRRLVSDEEAEAVGGPRQPYRPPGATPPPPPEAPPAVRRAWLKRRLQQHVDAARERVENDGYTDDQELNIRTDPRAAARHRGSQIDQVAKDTVMDDPDLAAVITAPDRIPEPDFIDSALRTPGDDWYDATTAASWQEHLRRYFARYGRGGLLRTGRLAGPPSPTGQSNL